MTRKDSLDSAISASVRAPDSRVLPPILGRRRGWILIYQACLAVCIAVMGMSSPTKAPYVLGGIAVLLAFLSASQDIVIDAYRVDAIPPS